MSISRKWEHQAPRGTPKLPNFVSGVVFQISSHEWSADSSPCFKKDVVVPYSKQMFVQVELVYF